MGKFFFFVFFLALCFSAHSFHQKKDLQERKKSLPEKKVVSEKMEGKIFGIPRVMSSVARQEKGEREWRKFEKNSQSIIRRLQRDSNEFKRRLMFTGRNNPRKRRP